MTIKLKPLACALALLLSSALLSQAALSADTSVARSRDAQLQVVLTIADPCLNSANIHLARCSSGLTYRTSEAVQPLVFRNADGSLPEGRSAQIFRIRTISYY